MNFNNDTGEIFETYAEINVKTLKNNFDKVRNKANQNRNRNRIKVCSIVKANAYGHGMNETGKILAEYGTDYLGTADYTESVILHDYLKKFSKKKSPRSLSWKSDREKVF